VTSDPNPEPQSTPSIEELWQEHLGQSSKFSWTWALGVGCVAFLFFTVSDAFRFVDNGQNLVLFSRVSGLQATPLPPGFHLVWPLLSETYAFDVKTKILTWKDDDPTAFDPRLISLSRDGQQVRMEVSLQYRVSNPVNVFTSLGEDYEEYVAAVTRSVVFSETGRFSAQSLYSTDRPILQARIREQVTALMQPRGIEVQDLLLRDVGFSTDFVKALEAKTIAENQLTQKDFEIQQARQDARTVISQAEAEAGGLRAKADALTRNPRYLDVVKSGVFGDTLDTLVAR
jgi:regulator of protease activity HflC (stomatin/prohibitin superfamily)